MSPLHVINRGGLSSSWNRKSKCAIPPNWRMCFRTTNAGTTSPYTIVLAGRTTFLYSPPWLCSIFRNISIGWIDMHVGYCSSRHHNTTVFIRTSHLMARVMTIPQVRIEVPSCAAIRRSLFPPYFRSDQRLLSKVHTAYANRSQRWSS